jgi:RND family efflux transporter MFP subunit
MIKKHICAVAGLVLVIAGCSTPGEKKAEAAREGSRPAVAVEVAKVVTADLEERIDVVGSLAPKFEADVKSEYSGVVTEVYVTEWVRVKKGTLLAKLDTREISAAVEAARAALVQAEVAENKATREYARTLKLKEVGLITQQNMDDALSAKEAAIAATASARAQLNVAETRLAKAVISAPMDGVISFRGVSVGDYVENMGSTKPMFRIVDNRLLDMTVAVPSGNMGALRLGQPLTFSTDVFPGRTFTGRVMYINPAVDEVNRSVKVVAEVRNEPEELRGGLFVKGQVLTGTRNGVLVIPRAALLSWDVTKNQGEVFVVRDQNATMRTVHTGSTSGDVVEIVSGLSAGELVVTRGAFNVREGDKLDIKPPQGA